MSYLAVLFALDEQDVEQLKAVPRAQRSEYMHEKIEDIFFDQYPQYTQELETSWNAIHRMLTDGSLNFHSSYAPLCNVILGGEPLYGLTWEDSCYILSKEEDDEFIILKTPEQVKEITEALSQRTKEECQKCYSHIDEKDYGAKKEEDFEYAWKWLQRSMNFWMRAAEEKRYVLFAVDR